MPSWQEPARGLLGAEATLMENLACTSFLWVVPIMTAVAHPAVLADGPILARDQFICEGLQFRGSIVKVYFLTSSIVKV